MKIIPAHILRDHAVCGIGVQERFEGVPHTADPPARNVMLVTCVKFGNDGFGKHGEQVLEILLVLCLVVLFLRIVADRPAIRAVVALATAGIMTYVVGTAVEAKTKALDFEFVYSVFSRINFWLPHASIENLKSLQKDDPRYKMLNKFPLKIYNYDKIKSENGGIDFWENGVYRPDLVLLDLAKIFHPELVPTHSLIWYRALQW